MKDPEEAQGILVKTFEQAAKLYRVYIGAGNKGADVKPVQAHSTQDASGTWYLRNRDGFLGRVTRNGRITPWLGPRTPLQPSAKEQRQDRKHVREALEREYNREYWLSRSVAWAISIPYWLVAVGLASTSGASLLFACVNYLKTGNWSYWPSDAGMTVGAYLHTGWVVIDRILYMIGPGLAAIGMIVLGLIAVEKMDGTRDLWIKNKLRRVERGTDA